jgi:hypothetical protein
MKRRISVVAVLAAMLLMAGSVRADDDDGPELTATLTATNTTLATATVTATVDGRTLTVRGTGLHPSFNGRNVRAFINGQGIQNAVARIQNGRFTIKVKRLLNGMGMTVTPMAGSNITISHINPPNAPVPLFTGTFVASTNGDDD